MQESHNLKLKRRPTTQLKRIKEKYKKGERIRKMKMRNKGKRI
jgi:hypothetical protein